MPTPLPASASHRLAQPPYVSVLSNIHWLIGRIGYMWPCQRPWHADLSSVMQICHGGVDQRARQAMWSKQRIQTPAQQLKSGCLLCCACRCCLLLPSRHFSMPL